MNRKLITRILITLVILFIGSMLYGGISISSLDLGLAPLDTPEGLGTTAGLGLPTLLMITGIGIVVALVSKKHIAGIIISLGLSWLMAEGTAYKDGQLFLLSLLITGGVASLIILLWWGKLDKFLNNRE